jgi:molybdopterin/thiamine biosynthesis adenylyltransferase
MSSPVDEISSPTLTDEQMRRYARHILLPDVGGTGQLRLLAATVAVEVGDETHAEVAALAYLAAAGVGTLELAGDSTGRVTAADIAGGILYAATDVDRPRIDAIRDRVGAINPDVTVVAIDGDGLGLSGPMFEGESATVADAIIAGGAAAVRILEQLT